MTGIFFQAVAIGFCIAAPIGPCGLLCISRSLRGGFGAGFATGAGVALADTLYALIGAFGVSAMIAVLEHWAGPLRIVGALFLIYLGLRIALTKPKINADIQEDRLHSAFVSSFLVTLANPMTIFAFIAIFAGLGVAKTDGVSGGLLVVLGVGLGSLSWWMLLSWLASFFGKRLHPERVSNVTRFAGWIIVALGVAALITFGQKIPSR